MKHFIFVFLFFCQFGFAQSDSVKIGSKNQQGISIMPRAFTTLSGNTLVEKFNFNADFGIEAGLGSHFSLAMGGALEGYRYDFSPYLYANSRYYFCKDKVQLTPKCQLTKSAVSSGAYVGLNYHYIQADDTGDFINNNNSYDTNPYQYNWYLGAALGRQYWGILDLGVTAGVEDFDEKTYYASDVNGFLVAHSKSAVVKTYSQFSLPVSLLFGNVKVTSDCGDWLTRPKNSYLKLGVENLFVASKTQLLFNPKVSFEQHLMGRLSANVNSNLLFHRFKQFDKLNSVSLSDLSYIHQKINFELNPQLRYYVITNQKKSGQQMNGIYLAADGYLHTFSEEVKRSAGWDFDRFSHVYYGASVGYQKQYLEKFMIDWYIGIVTRNKENTGIKAGLQYYFVK